MNNRLKLLLVVFILSVTAACSIAIPTSMLQMIQKQVQNIQVEITSLPVTGGPSADVVQLADEAGMTQQARAVFFATQPEIDTDVQQFDQNCQIQAAKNTAELGCFTTDGRIFLLNISDPNLHPELAVVAAHEMLHAAYEQMNPEQQAAVNAMIERQYRMTRDPNLTDRMRFYKSAEPGQRDNELHSIFGTEYSNLTKEMENYYAQYFTKRSQLVSANHQFDVGFSQLATNLAAMKYQVDRLDRQMQSDLAHNNKKAYNQLLPTYNAAVQQYDQDVAIYNSIATDPMQSVDPAVPAQ